jgi:hypothetical protein
VATLTFYVLLLVAGAQDIVAQKLDVSITVVTRTLQALAVGLPVASAVLTHRLCRDLSGATELAARKERIRHPVLVADTGDLTVASATRTERRWVRWLRRLLR